MIKTVKLVCVITQVWQLHDLIYFSTGNGEGDTIEYNLIVTTAVYDHLSRGRIYNLKCIAVFDENVSGRRYFEQLSVLYKAIDAASLGTGGVFMGYRKNGAAARLAADLALLARGRFVLLCHGMSDYTHSGTFKFDWNSGWKTRLESRSLLEYFNHLVTNLSRYFLVCYTAKELKLHSLSLLLRGLSNISASSDLYPVADLVIFIDNVQRFLVLGDRRLKKAGYIGDYVSERMKFRLSALGVNPELGSSGVFRRRVLLFTVGALTDNDYSVKYRQMRIIAGLSILSRKYHYTFTIVVKQREMNFLGAQCVKDREFVTMDSLTPKTEDILFIPVDSHAAVELSFTGLPIILYNLWQDTGPIAARHPNKPNHSFYDRVSLAYIDAILKSITDVPGNPVNLGVAEVNFAPCKRFANEIIDVYG